MRINSFLGLLDLGFGVFMMTALLSVSGTYSFLSNLFSGMDAPNKIAPIVVLLSTASMIYIWACASNGVYENVRTQKIISSALFQWSVFVIYWIVLLLLSKNSYTNMYVCLKGNCPESLWLYNNRWNDDKTPTKYNAFIWDQNSISGGNIMSESTVSNNTSTTTIKWSIVHKANEPKILFSRKSIKDKISVNMIIIICNIVFYLGIFTYGWILLYSYNKELKQNSTSCDETQTNLQKDTMEMV